MLARCLTFPTPELDLAADRVIAYLHQHRHDAVVFKRGAGVDPVAILSRIRAATGPYTPLLLDGLFKWPGRASRTRVNVSCAFRCLPQKLK